MPAKFPSAEGRTQWRMTTIGVLPWIDWNYSKQHVHVTDDGTVWIVTTEWFRAFSEGSLFDGGYFVGRLLDDGSIQRISPDEYAYEGSSVYGYLPHGMWSATASSAQAPQWCDGRYVWVWGGGAEYLERFDTETLNLSLMNDNDTPTLNASTDSHDVSLATINYSQMSDVVDDGEYLYWIEPKIKNAASPTDSDRYLGVLRRMSLASPHPVETVNNGWASPDGYTAGTWLTPFYGLDTTVFIRYWGGTPSIRTSVAIYNDHLLFSNIAWTATGDYLYRICQWPLAGGDIRVLYEVDAEGTESGSSDVDEVRGGSWSLPYHGFSGPDLEGFTLQEGSFTVVDDYLVVTNLATANSAGGRVPNMNNVAFHLPSLLAASADGPVKHDRANPFYTMMHNGTGNYESFSTFNFEVRDRYYGIRDGSQPLVDTNLINAVSAGRGDLSGSLVFASNCYFQGLQYETGNLFVHKLSPAEVNAAESVWNVTLSFEGKTLEGYGRQSILHGKEAPKEVVLE